MKICGVYQILNLVNKKKYIGQSISINERFSKHKYQLNTNSHGNISLQRAWNKYGAESFRFEILIRCQKKHLKKLEKQEVEKIPIHKRYNISNNYDNLYGINNPFYGKKHTNKTRKKLSAVAKKRIGILNPNYGNRYSSEQRIKSGHNKKTKLNKKQVQKIIKTNNKTHQQIADIYNVSRTLITRIKNGTRWNLITNIESEEKI